MQSQAQLLKAQKNSHKINMTVQAVQPVLTKRIEIAAHSNLSTCQGV